MLRVMNTQALKLERILPLPVAVWGYSKLINTNRTRNRFTTFYLHKESILNDYIRSSKTVTQLIELLNMQDRSSLKEIVMSTKRVPSTISWHIKRLETAGVVYSMNYGKNRISRSGPSGSCHLDHV